ncbi:hypothetical protein IWX90DRAFT_120280 [Phyllosticta citrichinensis]|uniref:Uncharacterized protein n=1 Tax=Phyllosticta citrichinensis TaxID=1130410 RepID=A0ABR1Y3L5_9PEZI
MQTHSPTQTMPSLKREATKDTDLHPSTESTNTSQTKRKRLGHAELQTSRSRANTQKDVNQQCRGKDRASQPPKQATPIRNNWSRIENRKDSFSLPNASNAQVNNQSFRCFDRGSRLESARNAPVSLNPCYRCLMRGFDCRFPTNVTDEWRDYFGGVQCLRCEERHDADCMQNFLDMPNNVRDLITTTMNQRRRSDVQDDASANADTKWAREAAVAWYAKNRMVHGVLHQHDGRYDWTSNGAIIKVSFQFLQPWARVFLRDTAARSGLEARTWLECAAIWKAR